MKQYTFYFAFFVVFIASFYKALGQTDHWETIFYSDTNFSYFTSTEGNPASDWRTPGFNDTAWRTGKGGIGYNDGDDNTTIEKCISVSMRTSFTINEIDKITEAVLNIDYDDAFVAYLNGVEIARSAGLSGNFPEATQVSTNDHEAKMYNGGSPESFSISTTKLSSLLNEGKNVIAIQVHNTQINSSDMSSNVFFSIGISDKKVRYLPNPEWFKPPVVFSGTNLPLLLISTNGGTIVNEPKIEADLKIIHNETGLKNNLSDVANVYNGKIGIERRGASSYNYPQRPYSFETRNADGTNNNLSILGMPEENDWILLSHYNDKTLMRNAISFNFFREMGHYSVRSRLVDVVLNGQYQGIYLLCEKVKRDKNRVDIAKLKPEDIQGDDLTGGYIFKVDYNNAADSWQSNYSPIDHPTYSTRFVYYYPAYDEILNTQRNYIKTFVDNFQEVLHQNNFADYYNSYLHDSSFIDYFILSELSRNVDGYKKSRYLYKDKDSNGGLIKAGPVWDFDWAWKNIYDCDIFRQTDGSGWAYKINDCYPTASPGWYVRLLQDPVFANKINCRYFQLRETVLSDESITSKIDSIYDLVNDAQVYHYSKWDILGTQTGAPEVESPAQTYNEEVSRLKSWIGKRLTWLDNNMVGNNSNCLTFLDETLADNQFIMYPNPASTTVNIKSSNHILQVELLDLSGRILLQKNTQYSRNVTIELNHLKPGLYLCKSTFANSKSQTNKLIIK